MSIKPLGKEDGLEFVRQLIGGDPDAAARLNLERPELERTLVSIGSTAADATEIVANMLGDCCKPDGKLSKFKGTGPLTSFLKTIARRAWIDWVRRDVKSTPLPNHLDQLPGDEDSRDDEVVAILKEALLEALAESDPENLLILRLIYEFKLKQQDLRIAWDCSAATVSRKAAGALQDLRERLVAKVRDREPSLRLEWADFLTLCADSNDLFASS